MNAGAVLSAQVIVPVAFGAMMIAMAAFAVVAARRHYRQAGLNLRSLAETLGLQVVSRKARPVIGEPPPRLEGTHRGRRVSVYGFTTRSGKNTQHWCALAAEARNPGGLTLRVSAENLATRVGRALGIDDVKVGDEAFDRQFYVRGSDAAYLRAALLPEVRVHFIEAWKAGARGTLTVEGGEAKYVEQGTFSRKGVCERFGVLAGLACEVAEIVEVYR